MDTFDLARHHGHKLTSQAMYSPDGPETDLYCETCDVVLCTLYPEKSKTRIGDNGTEIPFPKDAVVAVAGFVRDMNNVEGDIPLNILPKLEEVERYLEGDDSIPFPRADIEEVVNYLWGAEEIHYEESDEDPDHIFCKLVRINQYLTGDKNDNE